MAIERADSTTSKSSTSKKIVGYFNVDWEYKHKGEKTEKRIGGMANWGKDPALQALFEAMEKNPDQEITIKLSVKRNAEEVKAEDISFTF